MSLVRYRDDGPSRNCLHDAERARVLLLCFRAGQEVDPCVMERDVIFVVVSGRGILSEREEDAALRPNVMVTVPSGTERMIRAEDDLVVLAIQT
ncbi:MAG: hypothetical protein R6U70_09110 [Bacillota bacterium]